MILKSFTERMVKRAEKLQEAHDCALCNGNNVAEENLGCGNKSCQYRDVDGACDIVGMCSDAAKAIADLLARAELAEKKRDEYKPRAEKAEKERDELAALCGKLITLCDQPQEWRAKLFRRIQRNMIGDYMGSGYPFVDSFNRLYTEFEETASDGAYRAIRKATDEATAKRGPQKEE